ncbi:putative BTB/POZ domain-containing protein [Colletotrichum sublineola]|uniref:Putative BTB/POZ domain-containing protein n=1 Tax=Colletotrichum sublineola TaxID=1173701 RepID=A0A066Y2D6_COLSU|nr:putative BTB/POZ domain-containing protein [Colletotrichum sublineola]
MGCLDGSWLLETGKFSDFTIVCQNTEFRVHKAVLYPQSDYFAALFDSNMEVNTTFLVRLSDYRWVLETRSQLTVIRSQEAQKGVVTFDDIDPKIMKHLIDFFYSDYHGFEFDHSELKIHVEVWILADRLQASPAMITIENRLMYHLEEYEEKEAAFYEENILDMVFSHPACAKSAVGKIFAETAWIVFSNEKDECSSHILTSFTKYPDLAREMLLGGAIEFLGCLSLDVDVGEEGYQANISDTFPLIHICGFSVKFARLLPSLHSRYFRGDAEERSRGQEKEAEEQQQQQ